MHDWIGSYAREGWPENTPTYAIQSYFSLLTSTGDVNRLSALARDYRRHAFLWCATGSDYAALTEIRTAQRLITAQDVPSLRALVEFAVCRHAISARNEPIPFNLPSAWARLGRFGHAEALASTITSASRRTSAFMELATLAVQAHDSGRAFRLATEAETSARSVMDPPVQALRLAELALLIAQAGDPDRAEALARSITNTYYQARALTDLAMAAQADDSGRASRLAAEADALARTITFLDHKTQALARLTLAAAHAGDHDRASRLAAEADGLLRSYTRPEAFADLAWAAAETGDHDRASRLDAETEMSARRNSDPEGRTWAFAAWPGPPPRPAITTARPDCAPRRSSRPGESAPGIGRGCSPGWPEPPPRPAITTAHLAWPSRSRPLSAELPVPTTRRGPLLTWPGLLPQSVITTALLALPPKPRSWPAGSATWMIAALPTWPGLLPRSAIPAAPTPWPPTITRPSVRASAFIELASLAVQGDDSGRASRLAAEAETLARAETDPIYRTRTLGDLAEVAARAGDRGRASDLFTEAEALALTIEHSSKRLTLEHSSKQTAALASLARAAARAGEPGRAEAVARIISRPVEQERALADLIRIAAGRRSRPRITSGRRGRDPGPHRNQSEIPGG